MAALSIPVLFMAGSLAVDTTNAMSMKARLQNAADATALATVTRLAQEKNLSSALGFADHIDAETILPQQPRHRGQGVRTAQGDSHAPYSPAVVIDGGDGDRRVHRHISKCR